MKKKDDEVLFEVSQGVEEEYTDLNANGDVLDEHAAEDVPVAVTVSETVKSSESHSSAKNGSTGEAGSTRRSAWKVLAVEDLPAVSVRDILGGDYLIGDFLRHNIGFILLLVAMGIIYISNRYGAQQEIIEEENLRHELTEKKNYALTQYAVLTMRTRQSALEQKLKSMGDSTLLAAKEAPFIILRNE